MDHPSVALVASGLADRGIATFRYQFPFMQTGSKRPDSPPVAHATVRAAVNEAALLVPGLALVAGGRSFGGRMTSQAQARCRSPMCAGWRFWRRSTPRGPESLPQT
jgi:predicted alpha/beta-hydrolase family hydrolase